MPNVKITAMPSLGGNQVPTDLVTAVDLSAAPVNQNVKSTLNDLFATITKNITDRAIRFQAPGSAPAVAAASQGALYHNGTAFLASSNGGAYEPVYTLSAQSAALVFAGPASGPAATPTFRALTLTDLPAGVGTVTSVGLSAPSIFTVANSPVTGSGTLALSLATQSPALVFAGPTSGGAATPTFRALALTDLPSLATNSLLGRVSAGTGSPEQITSTAALLTWLQNPSSANLISAVTDETGGGLAGTGLLVFNDGPTIITPTIANIRSGSGQTALRLTGSGSNNFVEIVNAAQPTGPTIQAIGTPQADISLLIKSKGLGSVDLTGSAIRAIGPTTGLNTDPGILEARGGNQQFGGGKIYLYERSNNGTNYVGFEAPDSIVSDIFWTLPAADGTANQCLQTNGGGTLSFGSYLPSSNPAATGAMTITNSGNVVPLTITNSGTANTLVVEDVGADLSPFVIANDGRVIVGALTGNAFDSFTIGGTLLSASNASVANVVRATIPSTTTSAGASFASAISTTAAAFTLATLEHFVAIQGTFAAPSVVTQQFGFSARSSMSGAGQNYGFFSAVPAGTTNWSFFSQAGAGNSRFAGQVLHEAGTAAAPSITIDGDLNTGLAQIGGADTISVTTGGVERLRAKSGGAIRFIPLTAAPGSPEAGDVYYNSTTNKLQVYNGTAWQDCN